MSAAEAGAGTSPREAGPRGVSLRVAALFVLSGTAALALETACFRACGLLFGATHAAAGAVLASFMGGLALGAALGARFAPALTPSVTRLRPARAYALCELVVGAWAIALPAALPRAQEFASTVGPVGRIALAFALLAPGTVAMGATTPLLAQASVESRAALRAGLARLYSANLFGGALGALLAGFTLLPSLGLAHTLHAGGALAALTGALAWALLREREAAPESEAREGETPVASQVVTRTQGAAALALAGVGFVSFSLQVAQHRVFALLLGSAAYTFALVTAVTLAALALGGRAAGRSNDERDRTALSLREDPLWARAARRLLWVAIAAHLGQLVVRVAPVYLRASVVAGTSAQAVGLARALLVLLVVGAPAYQIGALFPSLAARVPGRTAGRTAGLASLASTAGNVAGALLAGFAVVPALGVQRAMELPGALALALALGAAALAGPYSLRSLLVSSALAVAFALGARGAWDPVALSAGSYRVAANRALARGGASTTASAPCGPERTLRGNRVLYARDGALGTVVVLAHAGGDDCTLYSLRVDGKAEGSAFVRGPVRARISERDELYATGDLPSEILAGWLPVAAGSASTREAFVVGWGTGLSVRALLDAGAARVTSAELEPAVLEAAAVFDARALVDPRVRLVRDDARMALRRERARARYDVIVSHPSNPWVTGASALFSVEYFELVRARLAPGGRAVAWVQLYETDRDAVRALTRTFLQVFPWAYAFRPGPASRDLFLLGAVEPATLPADEAGFARAFTEWQRSASGSTPAAARPLAWLGVRDAAGVALMLRAGPGSLRAWTAGVPVVRDDSAALEYRVADRLLAGESAPAEALLEGLGHGFP